MSAEQEQRSRQLIEQAYATLAKRPGFVERPDQRQLSLTLADMMAGRQSIAAEAPTGLGKSLAILIPAIARAIVTGQRTVIATYTNILAEQYWTKDLPLALSLFEDETEVEKVKSKFLLGKQRYACLVNMDEIIPDSVDLFREQASLGIESDFTRLIKRPAREQRQLWQNVTVPTVCASRACPLYNECYYYKARQEASEAQIVITNHSVVLQDSFQAAHSDSDKGFLGAYQFLVIDEAHDFYGAAIGSLEFEVSTAKVSMIQGVAGRLQKELATTARMNRDESRWLHQCEEFRLDMERVKKALVAYRLETNGVGILATSPVELEQHPQVAMRLNIEARPVAQEIAEDVADSCRTLLRCVHTFLEEWDHVPHPSKEAARNYCSYIEEFGEMSALMLLPMGVTVSFAGVNYNELFLRQDVVEVDERLQTLLWNRVPTACLSATLAIDGEFEFFERSVGFRPDYREILPTPFDFESQAALYLPPLNKIPDPSTARKMNAEAEYYDAIAAELKEIIKFMGGRTLALFHSRREMEAVYSLMDVNPDFPIFIQPRGSTASISHRFKRKVESSLFALRSFWTGFDAPGETLSCVAIVRIPFEVPTDPPAVLRMAHLQSKGYDPFQSFTLPVAKMMIRQGAGRLIRSDKDHGIIAILDPRIRAKRYGEQLLANLPQEMRIFDDFGEAAAVTGLAVI